MLNLVRFLLLACLLFNTPAYAEDARALAERLEAKAINGDRVSAYKLGLLFSQGKKVAPDYMTAFEWFERAANQGYIRGMLKVAEMYLEGQGVPQNLEQALIWNKKAARNNSSEAMLKVAKIYTSRKETAQAAQWFKKAAIKGKAEAMRELGSLYYKGEGVHFDLEQAFAWLELAVQKKDSQAQRLQQQLRQQKGDAWADALRRRVNNRMIPESYWNAH